MVGIQDGVAVVVAGSAKSAEIPQWMAAINSPAGSATCKCAGPYRVIPKIIGTIIESNHLCFLILIGPLLLLLRICLGVSQIYERENCMSRRKANNQKNRRL